VYQVEHRVLDDRAAAGADLALQRQLRNGLQGVVGSAASRSISNSR
jgi:hypothetical protein